MLNLLNKSRVSRSQCNKHLVYKRGGSRRVTVDGLLSGLFCTNCASCTIHHIVTLRDIHIYITLFYFDINVYIGTCWIGSKKKIYIYIYIYIRRYMYMCIYKYIYVQEREFGEKACYTYILYYIWPTGNAFPLGRLLMSIEMNVSSCGINRIVVVL